MKIILAQGNFGSEYIGTRHNVGFDIIDQLAEELGTTFKEKSKFKAEIAEFSFSDEKILLVKPRTFYNETGMSVRALCDFYKVNYKHDLLIIHDDLSLPFGTIRSRDKGSDAGNNGIKSIMSTIGTEFARIKIGISNDKLGLIGSTNFVLGKFTVNERSLMPKIYEETQIFINNFLNNKLTNHKSTINFDN